MQTKITLKQSEKTLTDFSKNWGSRLKYKGKDVTSIDYAACLTNDGDSTKAGGFMTLLSYFPGKNIVVKELPEMIGKSLAEVGAYITEQGWTPVGHEYLQWLYENPGKRPEGMTEDWTWYYGFASLFRYSLGRWLVPCVSGAGLDRDGRWFGYAWLSRYRVVLVETLASGPLTSGVSAGVEALAPIETPTLEQLAEQVRFMAERLKKVEGVINPELLK